MESRLMLDLYYSSSLQKIVFNVYGMKNMIFHTENSFLSLLFITSEKCWIRRIGLGQYGVLGSIPWSTRKVYNQYNIHSQNTNIFVSLHSYLHGYGVWQKVDTPYYCEYAFSCEDLALIRRICFPGYGVLDGLSAMGTRLGKSIMFDTYTSSMCMRSWGRLNYAHALIDITADQKLKKSMVIAIPKLDGNGDVLHTVKVEYECEPPRWSVYVFGHDDTTCPKCIVDEPKKKSGMNNDGFQQAPKRAFRGINIGTKF
ncbi:hypothetical protein Tco_0565923 [Tanacetum coccineum]